MCEDQFAWTTEHSLPHTADYNEFDVLGPEERRREQWGSESPSIAPVRSGSTNHYDLLQAFERLARCLVKGLDNVRRSILLGRSTRRIVKDDCVLGAEAEHVRACDREAGT